MTLLSPQLWLLPHPRISMINPGLITNRPPPPRPPPFPSTGARELRTSSGSRAETWESPGRPPRSSFAGLGSSSATPFSRASMGSGSSQCETSVATPSPPIPSLDALIISSSHTHAALLSHPAPTRRRFLSFPRRCLVFKVLHTNRLRGLRGALLHDAAVFRSGHDLEGDQDLCPGAVPRPADDSAPLLREGWLAFSLVISPSLANPVAAPDRSPEHSRLEYLFCYLQCRFWKTLFRHV